MVVETRYVTGPGVLVGAGAFWALLADPGDDAVLDELWQIAAHASTNPQALEQVAHLLETALYGAAPALAALDLGQGSPRTLLLGSGSVVADGATHVLSLGLPAPEGEPGPGRRLVSGVVAASAARVSPMSGRAAHPAPAQAAPAMAGSGLIDGIPDAILSARGPDGPPPPRRRLDPALLTPQGAAAQAEPAGTTWPDPQPAPEPVPGVEEAPAVPADPQPVQEPAAPPVAAPEPAAEAADLEVGSEGSEADRDADPGSGVQETTTDRMARLAYEASTEGADGPPAQADGEDDHDGSTVHRGPHLSAQELPTVFAVYCPLGHPSSPGLPACRLCHQRIAPQTPVSITRPALGGLRLPTGEVVPLDRNVIIGRKPAPPPGADDWPHLVHLPSDHAFVSRMHLAVELHGWDVVARDLGSRGGTTLTFPGREPFALRGGEAYVLEPGSVLDLAQVYAVRFETGAPLQ